jgi:hypothetical protein
VNVKPGVVVHTYDPSTSEGKLGGLCFQGQLGLHSKTLSQKKKKNFQNQNHTEKIVETVYSIH